MPLDDMMGITAIVGEITSRNLDILQKLLDQVDVGHHHPAAAVSLKLECVEGITMDESVEWNGRELDFGQAGSCIEKRKKRG